MTDGDITTRWVTPKGQLTGDQVTIDLDHTSRLSRVELSLGGFRGDYPRRLRVDVADGGAPPQTVWEGSTAGLTMLAAMADPARTPLTIDLPAGTAGRSIVLTLLSDEAKAGFSIAELRVFAR